MKILDLGTGPDWVKYRELKKTDETYVTCVDTSLNGVRSGSIHIKLIPCDIFQFLEDYKGQPFDKVVAVRVFEHIPYEKISYLLYLIKCVMRPNSELQIIVPDYTVIMNRLSDLDIYNAKAKEFNSMMIAAHTEIFNEPNDPHQSIWTSDLAHYYLDLEDYFSDISVEEGITLDNRDWYIEINALRV